MHMNIRLTAFTFAVLMLLAVSVHPTMAQMEVKQKIDQVNTAVSEIQASAKCPGCAGGVTPEQANMYLNRTNISVHIREIELDSGYSGPTVAHARTVSLPAGTLEVQAQGFVKASAGGTSDRTAAIIADYDRDPVVKAYIRNVTTVMGYTERTDVAVKQYAVDLKSVNLSQSSKGVFEVVTFTYTNLTTKYRFKFVATQALDASGKAIPPKLVLPGEKFPPRVEGNNEDADCWYWYLLIGIAVLAVIAAIAATIALAIGGAGGSGQAAFNKMRVIVEDPTKSPIQEASPVRLDELNEIYGEVPPPHGDESAGWEIIKYLEWHHQDQANKGVATAMGWFVAILMFLIILGLAFPLVAAALLFLASSIVGLLVCKGMVKDANDRAKLEQALNPEIMVGISERENGQVVFVPSQRSSHVMVVLPEKNENGIPYVWNVTSDPATYAMTMLLPDQDNPESAMRGWMFFTPLNKTVTFSARYVPAFGMRGPEKRTFSVRIVPLVWSPPVEVDTSSKWVGYGTSLAIDKKTDRMHISYLDYSGTWGGAGKLIYRSGIGSQWDPPVVVDDTISWTTADNREMARYTSIALDPDGNPHISYMDWRNGHLKYAHLTTWDKNKPRPPGTGNLVKNWWTVETVDSSSSYAGWGSSIAVDHEGNPHISYLVQEQGGLSPPTLKYAHWTTNSWKIKVLAQNLVGHPDGKFWVPNVQDGAITSIALDSQERPHISYVDANHDPAHSMTCGGEVCVRNYQLMHTSWNGTAWNTEAVDPDYNGGSYTRHGLYSSLALDSLDHPHISYFSYWNQACADLAGVPIGGGPACDYFLYGKLKYASYNGSVWSTRTVDDSTVSVGLYSSLEIDVHGNPHISYMDWKNGFLRYATSSGGSYWLKSIPDRQNSDTGRFSSLALDSKGFPRIVYMDYKNGHVKYVYGTFPELSVTGMADKPRAALASATGNSMTGSAGAEQVMLLQLPVPTHG